MNKYIIPICILPESKIYIEKIVANSLSECQDKLMTKFSEYSDEMEYHEFVKDLDSKDILVGDILDIEAL